MKRLISSLLLILLIGNCCSFQQEITVYTGINATGNSYYLKTKEPNTFSLSEEIFSNVASFCARGLWELYTGENYQGVWANSDIGNWGGVNCYSYKATAIRSVRHFGAADTESQSISMYGEPYYRGEELAITQDSFTPVHFPPRSLYSTGSSNWTFFEGENFNGMAVCYVSRRDVDYIGELNETISINIKSVVKGCNLPVDKYVQS